MLHHQDPLIPTLALANQKLYSDFKVPYKLYVTMLTITRYTILLIKNKKIKTSKMFLNKSVIDSGF